MTPALRIRAPSVGEERTLLVMYPGLNMAAEDFVAQGFVAAVHERDLPVDVAILRASSNDYLDGALIAPVHEAVIEPARAEGTRRVVLMGLSLGAMGALLYARAHPGTVDGIVVVAPFLGTPGTIVAVERAGGLAHWQPGPIGPNEIERGLLAWLKHFCAVPPGRPWLVLGYGTEDRFRNAARLLADALPPGRVVTRPGAHDAPTWLALWRTILDQGPFKDGAGGA